MLLNNQNKVKLLKKKIRTSCNKRKICFFCGTPTIFLGASGIIPEQRFSSGKPELEHALGKTIFCGTGNETTADITEHFGVTGCIHSMTFSGIEIDLAADLVTIGGLVNDINGCVIGVPGWSIIGSWVAIIGSSMRVDFFRFGDSFNNLLSRASKNDQATTVQYRERQSVRDA